MIYFWPMKRIYLVLATTIVLLISNIGMAYILPLDFILSKNAAQTSRPIISLEQIVTFKEGNKSYSILEKWQIEGDKNLKLSAVGLGELKDHFKIQYLYNGKNRSRLVGKNKVSEEANRELFEKYLAVKSAESFKNYLKELGIPNQVRLSRASGAISFAIGRPSTKSVLSPQFWIDQDFFYINKIRLPSGAEVEFTDYPQEGLNYPKVKTITWSSSSASISVQKIWSDSSVSIKNFYPESLDTQSEIYLSNAGSVGKTIEEFYTRFR